MKTLTEEGSIPGVGDNLSSHLDNLGQMMLQQGQGLVIHLDQFNLMDSLRGMGSHSGQQLGKPVQAKWGHSSGMGHH